MQTYDENYRQLQMLLPSVYSGLPVWLSQPTNGPMLYIEIQEIHPHTQFIRMSYLFDNSKGEKTLIPDASIRIYDDVKQAEIVNCQMNGEGCWLPSWLQIAHSGKSRWQRNCFFEKWLSYLLLEGHSAGTMKLSNEIIPYIDDFEIIRTEVKQTLDSSG